MTDLTDFWSHRAATTIFAYVLAVFFLALFATVIGKIMSNRIDLGTMITEKDGSDKTSISRFQLLLFTLVIAGLYVILCIESGSLIDIPNGTLTLLGLSGGSFLVSKGIGTPTARANEKLAEAELEKAKNIVTPPPPPVQ